MDLSKLPKLSNTPKPPDPVDDTPSTPVSLAPPVRASGAEAWLCIVIGVILLLATPSAGKLWNYIFNRDAFEAVWEFTSRTGAPIGYTQSAFFLEDIGFVAFALLLVIEGVALLVFCRRATLIALVALSLGVVVLNLGVLALVWGELGFRLFPALAVAFGGYAAIYQWRLLRPAYATY